MSLKRAIDTYEDWHAKPARRVRKLSATAAAAYDFAGLAVTILYRSSKWNADGHAENYIHEWNETGTVATKCWLARRGGGRSSGGRIALSELGRCIAYSYYSERSGREVTREYGARGGPILAAIGRGRVCIVPRSGVIPIVWTGLRVTSRGLENIRR